jgi:GTP cyclohydrolase IV
VQARAAPRAIHLTRVGVKGVRKPVTVHRPGQRATVVSARFDLFVDLPKTQKGTHMSRNLEALADILDDEVVGRESPALENLCRRLAERLLEKHAYAMHAQVEAEADLYLPRQGPGGKASLEHYRLLAQAEAQRGPGGEVASTRRVGVRVTGMTACPCAMETARHKMVEAGHRPDADIPFITHNQRNQVTLVLDLPGEADVEARELVDLCEQSLSAPTFELLKRGDEGDLVIQAHGHPRFVEDVVREALHRTAAHLARLGPGTRVFASSEAEESIHKHNAYAERTATFAEVA